MPIGASIRDAAGVIVCCNPAAAGLCRQPTEQATTDAVDGGTYRLFAPDGTPIARALSPAALALRNGEAIADLEVVVQRPDGSRATVCCHAKPLFDAERKLAGAIELMVQVQEGDGASSQLAAIVNTTDDAILTLDHEWTITGWNPGAERLYKLPAVEAIGQPIWRVVPPDRRDQEMRTLARILRGERIDRYETVRLRGDGSTVDISLTASPLISSSGELIGISKIARDITERRRAEERRDLLIAEMNHRVKNFLSMAAGLVNLRARTASAAQELAADVDARFAALGRAHELTLPSRQTEVAPTTRSASLHSLIEMLTEPFELQDRQRVHVSGPDLPIGTGGSLTAMAMLLHELVTNAAKYGALSNSTGVVHIECAEAEGRIVLTWAEQGGPAVTEPGNLTSFGSRLVDLTVRGQLGGQIEREWHPDGLRIRISFERANLSR